MNKKFSNKKNKKFQKPSKRNGSSNKKNFQKVKFKNIKKRKFNNKKYQITYTNEPLDNTDVTMDQSADNDLIMRIGKYWDKKLILEPINTSNHIYISEDEVVYSLCENSIKILNFENLSTVDEIKQVETY